MAELVSALSDLSLPVLGRLKVACYLWVRNAAGKHALLFEWACQELCMAYNRKNKAPPPHVTCSQMWGFLCTVLKGMVADGVLHDLSPLNTHLFQVNTPPQPA